MKVIWWNIGQFREQYAKNRNPFGPRLVPINNTVDTLKINYYSLFSIDFKSMPKKKKKSYLLTTNRLSRWQLHNKWI